MKQLNNNSDYLNNLRHSCAHLLAKSVKDLWPGTQNAIGPAVRNGFYQDFDFGKVKISENDLPKIEKRMKEILKGWTKFDFKEVSLAEAKKLFKDNPYKIELAEDFAREGKKLMTNDPGNFLDLCKMGHVENPAKELQNFKLLSIAGAYWHGDEKNKMLTRIYGTAWPIKEELDDFLKKRELAKLIDHRKIGKELDLFTIDPNIGQGLILWFPKGNIVKEELEKWAKETEKEWGYQRVTTPNITKAGLFYTSGHLPYYKDIMYPPMKLDNGQEYYLKPMNCPFHHSIYSARPKSYRDLPVRLAEYGTCYRYEASGELFGMMRVRGFTQNDSHIYCTLDQAVDEFLNVMKLHEYYYQTLGIKEYYLELALRDPKNTKKYHGGDKMWILAEDLMRKAVAKTNIPMVERMGNAAFYGPKIDFIVESSIGKEFAVSTNQIDLFMGKRFNLKYIDEHGQPQVPVIIHRAPLGSHERFIGFLIEHYAGAFPAWLAPVQVTIVPISERHLDYAKKIEQALKEENIRVELDERNETMQTKIREATLQKVPYMGIIGDREIKNSEELFISIRTREGKDLGQINLKEFISKLLQEIEKKY